LTAGYLVERRVVKTVDCLAELKGSLMVDMKAEQKVDLREIH
jgi:hypothetical protein